MPSDMVEMIPFILLMLLISLYIVHSFSCNRVITNEPTVISANQYIEQQFNSQLYENEFNSQLYENEFPSQPYTIPPSPETPVSRSPVNQIV
jgi:hypothetical protein